MLRITEYRTPGRIVLKLEGRLSTCVLPELTASWRRAEVADADASIWVDLSDVCRVDAAGQALLTRMYRAGVQFVTRGCVMRELVREIAGS